MIHLQQKKKINNLSNHLALGHEDTTRDFKQVDDVGPRLIFLPDARTAYPLLRLLYTVITLGGAGSVREVKEVDERLHVPPHQDVLADCSPIHALEILVHYLLPVAAITVTGAATTSQASPRP